MAKAVKKTQELTLEQVLWNCRVDLRGVGSLDKNRDAVISLVFLKFAGDKFNKRREAIIEEHGENPIFLENVAFYNAENVFYLPQNLEGDDQWSTRWSYIVAHASDNDIAVKLDRALKELESANPSLKNTLSRNLFVSLGASKEKLKSLIDNVNQISEERFQVEDLIGRTYEYFLQLYAASGTKEDGEFYTPACVVELITEMIEPYEGTVYDPCCGSGGMFVQSMRFVDEHKGNKKAISVIGQESVQETWRLCKMNLAIRGISHNLGKQNASTFTDDQHKDKKVDFIMANPPFNLKRWWADNLQKDPRWDGYGVPRESNANYAWILHMISKLDVNHGVAAFLLANGALNDSDDDEIRKNILLKDKVEAIIVLPHDMFYTTDISVTLWILNMNKGAGEINGRKVRDRRGGILFMDLRTWDENIGVIEIDKGKNKKKTVLTKDQISRIKEIYNNWQSVDTTLYKDVPELCKSVKVKKWFKEDGTEGLSVEQQGWVLTPSKYIEFIDHDLDIDYETEMARIQEEMKAVLKIEKTSQTKLINAFRGIGYGIDED
ncbi:N-6 DNA methylase [Mycoplasma corogypsi]|uniref:N-6 DNA methylase n=1 Tax=Mycoplasma corogypsi TaxID=2106 RepID=UPI003873B9B4